MDKKVELQVINITNSQAQVGAFAMLLGEVDGERQLPIIIGPAEAQATALMCFPGFLMKSIALSIASLKTCFRLSTVKKSLMASSFSSSLLDVSLNHAETASPIFAV